MCWQGRRACGEQDQSSRGTRIGEAAMHHPSSAALYRVLVDGAILVKWIRKSDSGGLAVLAPQALSEATLCTTAESLNIRDMDDQDDDRGKDRNEEMAQRG